MPTKPREFHTDRIYHVFNRGVEKRRIALDPVDFSHFLKAIAFYQQSQRSTRLSLSQFQIAERAEPFRFTLIAYSLMPNHIHLVLKQRMDRGITQGIADLFNSYTRYFNERHRRVGPLFQGTFKSVPIVGDEQFIHVVRYVLINAPVAGIVDDPSQHRWSSFRELNINAANLTDPSEFLAYFPSVEAARTFILDQINYGRTLEIAKHDSFL